uniref:hypothetical protein n=1 Tax=Pelomonas sp. KK5 TaxID=1855730 RepID=UPI0018EA2D72
MKRWTIASALLLALACTAVVAGTATAPEPLPTEAFARLPRLAGLQLSPDGQRFAGLLNQDERTALVVRDLAGGRMKALLVTDNKVFTFNWVHWAHDDRLVVSLKYPSRRGHVDTSETRLLAISPAGGEPLNLVKAAFFSRERNQQIQDRVIDWMPDDGHHLLLQLQESAQAIEPGVYQVDVDTGQRRLVQRAMNDVMEWTADAQHRVRVALAMSKGGEFSVRVREPDGQDWRTLWTFGLHDDKAVWPLGFGRDPQQLYVRAEHAGRMAVFAVRLDQPGLPRRLLLAHADRDVGGELLHAPASGEVLGLRTASQENDDGEVRSELWDAGWQAQAKAIDKALPERYNRLHDISRDETRYLVYSSGNGRPGEYYLGDRRTGDLVLLGETYPELSAEQLAGKHAASIRARCPRCAAWSTRSARR